MPIISVVQALAALYVMGVGLCALNRMTPRTRHIIRLSYIVLVTGAAAAAASGFYNRDAFHCIFALGVALHLGVNRRQIGSRQ